MQCCFCPLIQAATDADVLHSPHSLNGGMCQETFALCPLVEVIMMVKVIPRSPFAAEAVREQSLCNRQLQR